MIRIRTELRPTLGAALSMTVACGGRPAPAAPAPTCGQIQCDWTPLTSAIDSAVAAGAAPGAVVAVSVGGNRFSHSAGQLGIGMPKRPDVETVYDVASLTKVVVLTTLAMMAVDEKRLALDAPVESYIPRFAGPGKSAVTVRHLLTHSSGLPAHRPLWRDASSRDSAIALVLATPLDTAPGARAVYSDLGAITLGLVVEQLYGAPLDQLAERRLFGPLHMTSSRFQPPESWKPRIPPTEQDPWRGRIVHGEVHDENAAFLGGIAGHAGLFTTATDLLTFGEWLLDRLRGTHRLTGPDLTPETVREFTRRQNVVAGSSRAVGWDTPAPKSSAGTRLSHDSFGHTGFTGTSIWVDPRRDIVVVLLSNRIHPSRGNERLAPLRAVVADRVVQVLEGTVR